MWGILLGGSWLVITGSFELRSVMTVAVVMVAALTAAIVLSRLITGQDSNSSNDNPEDRIGGGSQRRPDRILRRSPSNLVMVSTHPKTRAKLLPGFEKLQIPILKLL